MIRQFTPLFRRARTGLSLFLLLAAVAASGCGKKAPVAADDATSDATAPPAAAAHPGMPPNLPGANLPGANMPEVDPATVVVTVNGSAITRGEIDTLLKRMVGMGANLPAARMNMLRAQVGAQAEERLVNQKLLEQGAEKAGIAVTEADVAAKWKDLADRMPPGVTVEDQLKRTGMTQAQAKDELRQILRIEGFLSSRAAGPLPDAAAVQAYYDSHKDEFNVQEKVHARHVLMKVEPGADEATKKAVRAKLEKVRADIVKPGGKDFAEAAKECSDCPSSAQGGDLGTFGHGQMVPAFDKAAFALEPGVVSKIIETEFGFHIIKVDEKLPGGLRPLDEVKEDIRRRLTNKRLQTAHEIVIKELHAAAEIEHPSKG